MIATSYSCLGDMSFNPLESGSGLRYRSTLIEEDETPEDTLINAAGSNYLSRCRFHICIRNAYK